MTSDTKATPRPWTRQPKPWSKAYDRYVYGPDNRAILDGGAYRPENEAAANAELIVAAVNAYDADRATIALQETAIRKLKAEVETTREWLDAILHDVNQITDEAIADSVDVVGIASRAVARINAALAKIDAALDMGGAGREGET